MKTHTLFTALTGAAALTVSAAAQETPPSPPETRTVVTPVAPPATVVTPVAPNAAVVSTVPGIAVATKLKVESFADFDVDDNGVYSPMEFAQAMQFLASGQVGSPGSLPPKDKFMHKGTTDRIEPSEAVSLLNMFGLEFALVDMDDNWRVDRAEMQLAALM